MSTAHLETDRSVPFPPDEPSRRDFLYIATGCFAAVGAAAALWPLIDEMNPDASALASGAPIDVDVSTIASGQQITVFWRGKPIVVVDRPQAAVDELRNPTLLATLSDPDSTVIQQPPYAKNWARSAPISAAFRNSVRMSMRARRGPAAISAPAMARNTIWRGVCIRAYPRPIIYRSRPIGSPRPPI